MGRGKEGRGLGDEDEAAVVVLVVEVVVGVRRWARGESSRAGVEEGLGARGLGAGGAPGDRLGL